MLPFTKAHAYGNDFLYVDAQAIEAADLPATARRLCDRHRGVGADGLIVYAPTPLGASMKLLNADGSPAELSGNGLRGLAAILMRVRDAQGTTVNPVVEIETTAGVRLLTLERREGRGQLAVGVIRVAVCGERDDGRVARLAVSA